MVRRSRIVYNSRKQKHAVLPLVDRGQPSRPFQQLLDETKEKKPDETPVWIISLGMLVLLVFFGWFDEVGLPRLLAWLLHPNSGQCGQCVDRPSYDWEHEWCTLRCVQIAAEICWLFEAPVKWSD